MCQLFQAEASTVEPDRHINPETDNYRKENDPNSGWGDFAKELAKAVLGVGIHGAPQDGHHLVLEDLLVAVGPTGEQGVADGCKAEQSNQEHRDIVAIHRRLAVGVDHGDALN